VGTFNFWWCNKISQDFFDLIVKCLETFSGEGRSQELPTHKNRLRFAYFLFYVKIIRVVTLLY